MELDPLAVPSDLEKFSGAPFDPELIDIASASVRAEAGWHIAPVITETLTVDCYGGPLLALPTRRIVNISAIRDVTSGSTVLTDWRRMSAGVYRSTGWPIGTLEVDITHGYEATPKDLLPVIAARVTSPGAASHLAQRSVTRGPFSESETYRPGATDPVIARYAVLPGVA